MPPLRDSDARSRAAGRSSPSERAPVGGWPAFLDDLEAIVWEARPDPLEFTFVSAGAERLLGYPREHWLERDGFWEGIIHPDDRHETVEACRAAAGAGVDHDLEYRAIRRDGTVIWLRDVVKVVRPGDRGAMLLRGMMFDVSRAKALEADLRREENRYRLLADHVIDMVSLHAEDGSFLFVSPSVREILGWEPDELVGQGLERLVHPEDLPALRTAIEQELMGVSQPAHVFRARRKDGVQLWLETQGGNVQERGPDGGRRLVGVTRDISERKALQEELGKAQRLEALGRLAGGIAHDFNNILTVMRGHLDLLRDGLPPESAETLAGDLEEIDGAVARASSLTRQLLTFGRRDLTRPEEFDLRDTVRDLARMLGRLLPGNIQLVSSSPDEPLPVCMDPAQLEQALVNLAMNARDAMPEGGELEFVADRREVRASDPEILEGISLGTYALLCIRDTGDGMDAGTLSRIFDPFFTTKGADEGTGLGLAIVHGVLQQAGGHVKVRSEPGAGSAFELWLPMEVGGELEGAEEEASKSGEETVLVVDPEAELRNLIASVLGRYGYRVLMAASAEEALATFLRYRRPIDLLLSSVVLARGTGIELAERLRRDQPALSVVFTTTTLGPEARLAPLPSERTHLLEKPFSADRLAAVVRRALDEQDPASHLGV